MLIAEDELYRLPAHFLHVKPRNVRVCLWQHHLSANELLDYARLYQPGLAEDCCNVASDAEKTIARTDFGRPTLDESVWQ